MAFGPLRDLGPAIVVWGATTIEEIYEEVRWRMEGNHAEVFESLYGATPVDTVFLGYSSCEVVVPATRTTLAVLNTIIPGSTNSGGASGYVGVKAAGNGAEVGRSMYEEGKPLFIKPIVDGIAVANGKWLRLEHTYPSPNFDVGFNLTDQRTFGITFKAHPDTTSKLLWSMGDVAETDLTGY